LRIEGLLRALLLWFWMQQALEQLVLLNKVGVLCASNLGPPAPLPAGFRY
jgi:hypothetical protein